MLVLEGACETTQSCPLEGKKVMIFFFKSIKVGHKTHNNRTLKPGQTLEMM